MMADPQWAKRVSSDLLEPGLHHDVTGQKKTPCEVELVTARIVGEVERLQMLPQEERDAEAFEGLSQALLDHVVLRMDDHAFQDEGNPTRQLQRFEILMSHLVAIKPSNDLVMNTLAEMYVEYSTNPFVRAYRLGYHQAKKDTSDANVKRAAAGRSKIGKASLTKVKKSSEKYRHLSKTKAAEVMAKEVNLSTGHILRILSTQFPGENWK